MLVILVPTFVSVEPRCLDALGFLRQTGHEVRIVYGASAIDRIRCEMVTQALADGFDEIMWIDSDIVFEPKSVEQLRQYQLPIIAGIYPKRMMRELAALPLESTKQITFGMGGGLIEMQYVGTGFLYIRRQVFDAIKGKFNLPTCNTWLGKPLTPYFQPMIVETLKGPFYLSEDYAFCHRAREAGFKIMADTTIRLFHMGTYPYGIEDAGLDPRRYSTFNFEVIPQ